MKITGARQARFISGPPMDVFGVLLFGPDRGLVRDRAAKLSKVFLPDADDTFGATTITADDLSADPAKLSDELSALSLLGGGRLVRLRLDHERQAAAITKTLKGFDADPSRVEAKLIIEAGDMTPRSSIRKFCESATHIAALGCYAASARDLRGSVRDGLSERYIKITDAALDLWLPALEGDHALAQGEIEKMALYKGYGQVEGAEVDVADIRAVAAGGQSVSLDGIIHAALDGRLDEMDSSFRKAVEGKVNPVTILISLQRHLTRLTEAAEKMSAGESAGSAIRSLRPPVFRMAEQSFTRQLGNWPLPLLRRALSECLKAERAIKTAGAPMEAIVSRLLIALASIQARRG